MLPARVRTTDKGGKFYTFKGYQASRSPLTPAMEDYLEMIARMLLERKVVRIGELSERLNVRPSSASKMIQQLKNAGMVESEKYGYVSLTAKGREEGEYLLYRHRVVQRFLCLLNRTDSALEEAEKIEHFLSRETVRNLYALTRKLEKSRRERANSEE